MNALGFLCCKNNEIEMSNVCSNYRISYKTCITRTPCHIPHQTSASLRQSKLKASRLMSSRAIHQNAMQLNNLLSFHQRSRFVENFRVFLSQNLMLRLSLSFVCEFIHHRAWTRRQRRRALIIRNGRKTKTSQI